MGEARPLSDRGGRVDQGWVLFRDKLWTFGIPDFAMLTSAGAGYSLQSNVWLEVEPNCN